MTNAGRRRSSLRGCSRIHGRPHRGPQRGQVGAIAYELVDGTFAVVANDVDGILEVKSLFAHDGVYHVVCISFGMLNVVRKDVLDASAKTRSKQDIGSASEVGPDGSRSIPKWIYIGPRDEIIRGFAEATDVTARSMGSSTWRWDGAVGTIEGLLLDHLEEELKRLLEPATRTRTSRLDQGAKETQQAERTGPFVIRFDARANVHDNGGDLVYATIVHVVGQIVKMETPVEEVADTRLGVTNVGVTHHGQTCKAKRDQEVEWLWVLIWMRKTWATCCNDGTPEEVTVYTFSIDISITYIPKHLKHVRDSAGMSSRFCFSSPVSLPRDRLSAVRILEAPTDRETAVLNAEDQWRAFDIRNRDIGTSGELRQKRRTCTSPAFGLDMLCEDECDERTKLEEHGKFHWIEVNVRVHGVLLVDVFYMGGRSRHGDLGRVELGLCPNKGSITRNPSYAGGNSSTARARYEVVAAYHSGLVTRLGQRDPTGTMHHLLSTSGERNFDSSQSKSLNWPPLKQCSGAIDYMASRHPFKAAHMCASGSENLGFFVGVRRVLLVVLFYIGGRSRFGVGDETWTKLKMDHWQDRKQLGLDYGIPNGSACASGLVWTVPVRTRNETTYVQTGRFGVTSQGPRAHSTRLHNTPNTNSSSNSAFFNFFLSIFAGYLVDGDVMHACHEGGVEDWANLESPATYRAP
ncbi:hypothetical protein HD554DRAFT_2041788 [Boletus coccyginus]|nr:hypothetical protein HD554DRAFT_2041788 [Boletus coccyginus]